MPTITILSTTSSRAESFSTRPVRFASRTVRDSACVSIERSWRNMRISTASWATTGTIKIRLGQAGRRSCRTTAGLIPAMIGSPLLTDDPRPSPENTALTRIEDVRRETARIVTDTPVFDMHTHLFPPSFGALSKWGIDNVLTYHYLVAEVMRATDVGVERFRHLPQTAQADLIWDALFVRSTPLSEATRGVIRVLSALGIDPAQPDLRQAREFFRDTTAEQQVDRVFERARVSAVVMTNDPFDPAEAELWRKGRPSDPRFKAALRIDPLLNDWGIA